MADDTRRPNVAALSLLCLSCALATPMSLLLQLACGGVLLPPSSSNQLLTMSTPAPLTSTAVVAGGLSSWSRSTWLLLTPLAFATYQTCSILVLAALHPIYHAVLSGLKRAIVIGLGKSHAKVSRMQLRRGPTAVPAGHTELAQGTCARAPHGTRATLRSEPSRH